MTSGGASGWDAVDGAVAAARAAIAAAAPDAAIAAEGEAYVMRVLAACLNDAFLGHALTEDGLARALPVRGGPNPDYRMVHAPLDRSRRYRLEGMLNGSERVGVGLYAFGPGGSAELTGYAAFDAGSVDAAGGFAIEIAADADGAGGLAITPETRVVMIRTLHRAPAMAPARLVLSGGPAPDGPTLAGGSTEAALGRVAGGLAASVRTYLDWTAVTSAAANRFHAETPAMTQGVVGDPDTVYFLGGFDLADHQWLEVILPPGLSGYWSLHAYNYWCEPLPGSGTGDHAAVAEVDGSVRISIGPALPGTAPNRIDTLGRRRGALILRVIGTPDVAVPRTRLRGPDEIAGSKEMA